MAMQPSATKKGDALTVPPATPQKKRDAGFFATLRGFSYTIL
jgi:hypothetical protein